jgi:hypothetical protein
LKSMNPKSPPHKALAKSTAKSAAKLPSKTSQRHR